MATVTAVAIVMPRTCATKLPSMLCLPDHFATQWAGVVATKRNEL
ncbi:hypothetical protein [Lewinella sp. LCG006]